MTNIFRLKTFYSTYWDNVSKDPVEDRKTVKKLGATFSIKPKNLPFISFTYSRGDSKKSRVSGSSNINKDDIDSFSTYISYYKDNWDIYFSGDYSKSTNKYDSDSVSQFIYYYLGATYSPNDNFSISPAIGLSKEKYEWTGEELEYLSPSASVWFNIKSFYRNLDLYSYLSYYKYYGDDGFTDTNTFDGSATVSWVNKKEHKLFEEVSLKLSYLNYQDSIFQENSSNDLSVLLNLKFNL